MRTQPLPLEEEKRRHNRVRLSLLGRFMTVQGREYPCQVINISPGGAAFITPVSGSEGDRIVAYVDHIGRIEGRIVRTFDGGFAMAISATMRKREKLASQLTWLANRKALGLPEDRRHERVQPRNPDSSIRLPDGRTYPCRVIDMSISGAAVAMSVCPAIGTEVYLGRMRSCVVRHFDGGVAVEFSDVQDLRALADHFGVQVATRDDGGLALTA